MIFTVILSPLYNSRVAQGFKCVLLWRLELVAQDFSVPSWLGTLPSYGVTLKASQQIFFMNTSERNIYTVSNRSQCDMKLFTESNCEILLLFVDTKPFICGQLIWHVHGVCTSSEFFTFFTNLILEHAVQALAAKEVELGDSAPYFLDSAERLAQPGFLPSDEDILRCMYVTMYIHILLKGKLMRTFDK